VDISKTTNYAIIHAEKGMTTGVKRAGRATFRRDEKRQLRHLEEGEGGIQT